VANYINYQNLNMRISLKNGKSFLKR